MLQVVRETERVEGSRSLRLTIDPDVVARALAEAKQGETELKDYADTGLRFLVLRVRRESVSWLVKTKTRTKKIGEPPKMGVREARRVAPLVLAELRQAPPPAPAKPLSWSWERLRAEYEAYIASPKLKNGIVRAPSSNTLADVRLAFDRPQLASWRGRPITTVTVDDLDEAALGIQAAVSYAQAKKFVAYAKAAFKWARKNRRKESGLQALSPEFSEYMLPDPSGEEIERIQSRQRPTANPEFTVQELGRALAQHEAYCRGRIGRRKVSPGVRWGLWWDALTIVRSGAATLLETANIVWSDPHVDPGWALVSWPAELIKARLPFMLPIPPLGLHVLRCVQRDWRAAVLKEHGPGVVSKWAFPSTRRCGRNPDTQDVVVSGDAFANHLAAMRGERQGGHRDHLAGVPEFSIHTFRGTGSTFLLNDPAIPPGGASAFLGHVLPGDNDPAIVNLSPTTDRFYNLAQRIPLKALAMRRWSEALLQAYKDAGGVFPE